VRALAWLRQVRQRQLQAAGALRAVAHLSVANLVSPGLLPRTSTGKVDRTRLAKRNR
jgi:acyl-CoA synthetase (AMP-forming)/AMP-acid ligase II